MSKVPERLGAYRLIKPLGQGQVCQLWEVERGIGGDRLAMKLVLAGKDSREQIRSLRHEYNVGRFLRHPNVVRAFEFYSSHEATFVLMELFSPINLKQMLRESPERLQAHIQHIIRGAAEGVAYMHHKGWVHRDIKPDNFLVEMESGNVKLIDFNLAQRRRGLLSRLLPGKSKVQGTPSYMSPEQIRGDGSVDERSDVYSFACTAYELLAGKPPFTGSSQKELFNKHLRSRPPSLKATVGAINPAFASLIDRSLYKDPQRRPASMRDLLDELGKTEVFKSPPRGRSAGAAGHDSD